MEAERKLVHMHEGFIGKLTHRILADTGKQRIAKLIEPRLNNLGRIIGEHQHDRAGKDQRNVIGR